MHFADVDAVVACRSQVLDPEPRPGIIVALYSAIVRKVSSKQTGPRRPTRGRGHVTLGKNDPLVYQSIQMRRIHMRVAKRPDRFVALLVGVLGRSFIKGSILVLFVALL